MEHHPPPVRVDPPAGPMTAARRPYVGEGADGCRRSAEIDRSEAEGYDRGDPRVEECLASAAAWEAQADLEDAHQTRSTPHTHQENR